MPDWRQQEESEQRRYEEEQEMLKSDPGYAQWLDFIDAKTKEDREHAENSH
jgi:hypothetical protein